MARPILVTGAAGFIGFQAADALLARGMPVVGVDSFSPYYDPALKEARFARLQRRPGFTAARLDLADPDATRSLFSAHRSEIVLHLAAQPGVRHALTHPDVYAASNVTAFLNVLEGCRHTGVGHLVYASSSSVYGANRKLPFSEDDPVDHPISLYAATKRANELMAHSYAHLFGLPSTGLRFFTVYGPWGRPDMAVYRFTELIAQGEPIDVAAGGAVLRDFTFIDDAVEGILRVLAGPPPGPTGRAFGPNQSAVPFRLFNVGGNRAENLDRLIALIEASLGRTALRRAIALPPGDVQVTRADTSRWAEVYGALPGTPFAEGVARFVAWYREYHGFN